MLQHLRTWLQRTFSRSRPPTPDQSQRRAADARSHRDGSITALRSEIRGLQQQIKDVSDSPEGLTSDEHATSQQRLASLHKELERKQQELGALQARV